MVTVLDAEVKIGDTDTVDEVMETSVDEAEVATLTEEDEVVRSTDEDEVGKSTDEDEVERLTGDDEVRTTTDEDPEELRVETDTEGAVALDEIVVLETGFTVTDADVMLAVPESSGAEEVVVSTLTAEDDPDVTLAVIGLTSAEELVVWFAGVGNVPIGGCGKPVVPFEGAPPYHTPFHAATEPFFGSVPVTVERNVQESPA
ncbi:hypothetical protein LTR29_008974 [Friedmanniomyces endolithicus]|nr:hypothetical protein LTR29_008974 [Friedmanniomyces endolithicus]